MKKTTANKVFFTIFESFVLSSFILDMTSDMQTNKIFIDDVFYVDNKGHMIHFMYININLHDQDRLVRLIFLMMASTMATNDNFGRIPRDLSP
jgi:hypothetical protein